MANEIITSSSPTGMVITMNAFIDPSKQKEYIQALDPVYKGMSTHPECLFCAVSVNPADAGHIRIVHGWKKDSAWFNETLYSQSYFQEFVEKTKGMWVKPRIIEHFDLVPMN